jgi:hypothetical protein
MGENITQMVIESKENGGAGYRVASRLFLSILVP